MPPATLIVVGPGGNVFSGRVYFHITVAPTANAAGASAREGGRPQAEARTVGPAAFIDTYGRRT